MKILVLGGQGFIGYNLCLRLLNDKHEIIVFEKSINNDKIIKGVEYIEGDFTEIEKYIDIFNGVDAVYHLISTSNAVTSNYDRVMDINNNVISTIKLLDICKEKDNIKVIFSSSGGTVYGNSQAVPLKETSITNPITTYGINKLMIENYLYLYNKLFGLNYTVLRIANPYGPFHVSNSQGLINVFLKKILDNEVIEIWGDGSVIRDYIYIDDVIEALYLSLKKETNSKILNIGSSYGISINDIIKIMKDDLKLSFDVIYKESRNVDVNKNYLDISLAQKELNWVPKTNLVTGIQKTYKFNKKGE